MRIALAIAVGALFALPLVPTEAGDAPRLPYPRIGDTFYYVGEAGMAGSEVPYEEVVRFDGPYEIADRAGKARMTYRVETASAAGPGTPRHDPDAVLADAAAYRTLSFYDLATLERVETRTAASCDCDVTLGLAGLTAATLETGGRFAIRDLPEPGGRDPFALLWGGPVPTRRFETTVVDGAPMPRFRDSAGAVPGDPGGAAGSHLEAPDDPVPATGTVAFLPAGAAVVDGTPARRFVATYEVPWFGATATKTREVALAEVLPVPVFVRTVTDHGDGAHGHTVSLAGWTRGTADFPWGTVGPGGARSPAPESGAFGRSGPADGTAALAYPLGDAVGTVRSDPTLVRLHAVEAMGTSALVRAYYQGDTKEPRWWLLFADEEGREAIVESKRVAGVPRPVNRELLRTEAGLGDPRPEALPDTFPARSATIGAAVDAWRRAFETEHGPATEILHELRAGPDGAAEPRIWVGASRRATTGTPVAEGSTLEASFALVPADGRVRLFVESGTYAGRSIGPFAGPAPPKRLAPR
ncbi:MAG: hypothetical protein ACT4PT_04525 [Methanobacteriota archaeon]